MARRLLIALVFLAAGAAALGSARACARSDDPTGGVDTLSSDEAAASLRAAREFTSRPGSPIGRALVAIVAVRRIGLTSTEVEFTWRDAGPAGAAAPVRTSMALFRVNEDRVWRLTSLYKVD